MPRTLLFFQAHDCSQHHIADHLETFVGKFIQRIRYRVPMGISRTVIEIDEIHGADSAAVKRNMVVLNSQVVILEAPLIAFFRGNFPDQAGQRLGAVRIPLQIKICVADHVHIDQCVDLVQSLAGLPLHGQVPASVKAIGIGPIPNGFFTVEEDEHYGMLTRGVVERVGQFQQETGG